MSHSTNPNASAVPPEVRIGDLENTLRAIKMDAQRFLDGTAPISAEGLMQLFVDAADDALSGDPERRPHLVHRVGKPGDGTTPAPVPCRLKWFGYADEQDPPKEKESKGGA